MGMTRWALASTSRLLLLGLFAATVVAQEEEGDEGERPRLEVPPGKPPVVDGKIGEDEWADATAFEVRRGKEFAGKAWLKRHGRQLYFAYDSTFTAWALGVRLNFADPVTKRSNPLLITPLHPPRPPLAIFRKLADRPPEPVPITTCNVRFGFAGEEGFQLEARVPADVLEFTRAERAYLFSIEVWDLQAERAMAFYPAATEGMGGPQRMARLETKGAWLPVEGETAPEHDGLAVLEEMAREQAGPDPQVAKTPDVFYAYTGWGDGRRNDGPLARLQKRLETAIESYPEYISLRANLVLVKLARNDAAGALASLDALGRDFPLMAENPWHILIRAELLRGLEQYEQALAHLEKSAKMVEGDPRVADERAVLEHLRLNRELEERMRAEEAARADLPQVRLETTKGTILLELFEDDAPNGVANFISLVERGFYDGTRFHWAEGGRRVIGGDPESRDDDSSNDGFGDPGYLIEPEPGRRLNHAFAVAYADKRRTRRTEGCAFVIHLTAFPGLDGLNTVFGRVVEGHDVVRKLEHYDSIKEARVVRKREHAYEPIKRAP